nr:cysteine-rich CWC family protein [Hydrogenophaga crassostreae]
MELERATGQPQAPCWCTDESFPPDLLATLPESAQGASCICINCLRAHAQRGTP